MFLPGTARKDSLAQSAPLPFSKSKSVRGLLRDVIKRECSCFRLPMCSSYPGVNTKREL